MGSSGFGLVKSSRFFVYAVLLALFSSYAGAASCPKVNCDCNSLPKESWKKTCAQQEKQLIQQCADNGGEPTDFCVLHGPSAYPLPLATHFDPTPIIGKENIAQEMKRASTLYWAVHDDIEALVEKVDNDSLAQAQSIMKNIGENLDKLMTKQRQVTISLEVAKENDEAVSSWKSFSEDTFAEAEKLFATGTGLWDKRQFGNNKELDKAYSLLSIKVLRLASTAYEMAALAHQNAGQNKQSAIAWKAASEVSKSLMKYKEILSSSSQHISYYRKQAATRLLRASYHWQLDKENQNAAMTLNASREFLKQRDLVNDLLEEKDKPIQLDSPKAIAEY